MAHLAQDEPASPTAEEPVEPESLDRSPNSATATPLDPSEPKQLKTVGDTGERNDLEAIQRDVLVAFEGKIEPVKAPLGYRLGILLVAVVMVILPIIYLAVIAAIAYGVYYHAINHVGMLGAGSGQGKIMIALAYVAPMVVGTFSVVFMLKPLFSRPPKRGKPFSLKRPEETLVFAFVERICEAVGAPIPRRVDIDCQVNASASFRHGFWSMFHNDLVLTIGMPLVAGLNLRQFAGVLAHEFGHFSQGAGMRLTYIIRSISHWFTRVVYERDEWDEQLIEWSERTDFRIGWVLYLARFFVWLTRRVLWVLMMIGHIVSGLMLRQMEFDADRHEARLAGSDAFEETARQLTVLNAASQGAQSDLGSFYREGRLADDLPQLIMANVQQIPKAVLQQISESADQATTGLLDTHPCERDRIASARREDAAGIFRLDDPASILFRDFSAQSKAVTWEYYQDCLGKSLKRSELHPIDDLLRRQELEHQSYEAIDRFFHGSFNVARPLCFTTWSIAPLEDAQQAAKELKNLRQQLRAAGPKYAVMCKRFAEAENEDLQKLSNKMTQFEQAVGKRISLALALLHTPSVASKIDHAERLKSECKKLLPTLQQLESQIIQAVKASSARDSLVQMLNQLSEQGQDEEFIGTIRQAMRTSRGLLATTRTALQGTQYPFDHAKGKISVAEYALPELPDSEDPAAICYALDGLSDSILQLKARMTGQLCVVAESVESAIGLDPLPTPEREADENSEA